MPLCVSNKLMGKISHRGLQRDGGLKKEKLMGSRHGPSRLCRESDSFKDRHPEQTKLVLAQSKDL